MWFRRKLYEFAVGVIKAHGFSVVKIVERAGAPCLVGNDRRFCKIGGKK